ncbi:AAA family ATPase [Sorangium sp. So ce1024]|uniref:AAA family ATPase n=1 Tax=unclassified Sorangium TaxID=2621164 RepID=UPI003F102B5D
MYLREIHIRNLKLLRDLRLSFTTPSGEPRMWTVIVGENGLCKTSILQAIALAASGPDRANQLADIPSLPDRRHPDERLEIAASFEFGPLPEGRTRPYPRWGGEPGQPPRFLRSRLVLEPGWKVFVGSSDYGDASARAQTDLDPERSADPGPLREARAVGMPWWFVAGYGVNRRLPKPHGVARPDDPTLSRLDSLFDGAPILGTGFADILQDIGIDPRRYAEMLSDALFRRSRLLPRVRGLELRGRGGVKSAADLVEAHRFELRSGSSTIKLPATWLSHGYQGLISWIADLIGQLLADTSMSGTLVDPSEMSGLVLIDEIDLHLHPSWQAELVPKLKKVFPRMQFVVTTHSPLVLPGFAKDEIVRLGRNRDGDVIARRSGESPALMTGSELYEEFFGIDRLYPTDLGEAVQRYGLLANDPGRSDAEEEEMIALRKKLRAAEVEPEWEPVSRTRTREGRPAKRARGR